MVINTRKKNKADRILVEVERERWLFQIGWWGNKDFTAGWLDSRDLKKKKQPNVEEHFRANAKPKARVFFFFWELLIDNIEVRLVFKQKWAGVR